MSKGLCHRGGGTSSRRSCEGVFIIAVFGMPILSSSASMTPSLIVATHKEPPLEGTIASSIRLGRSSTPAEFEFDPDRDPPRRSAEQIERRRISLRPRIAAAGRPALA